MGSFRRFIRMSDFITNILYKLNLQVGHCLLFLHQLHCRRIIFSPFLSIFYLSLPSLSTRLSDTKISFHSLQMSEYNY